MAAALLILLNGRIAGISGIVGGLFTAGRDDVAWRQELVLRSLAFGIAWGMVGICPGPALVLLGSGSAKGIVFVGAMLLGVGIFAMLEKNR